MLDGWERLFGLDPLENDSTPRVKDTDRDRLSNYQEYLGSDGEAPILLELFHRTPTVMVREIWFVKSCPLTSVVISPNPYGTRL